MSNLSAFLHPVTVQEEKEIVISRRFLDEDGSPAKFKIRSITQDEADALLKQSTRTVKKRDGSLERTVDDQDFNRRLIVAATLVPDFKSTELCGAYGVMDPLMVPGKMLFSGEFSNLLREILDLSGLGGSVEDEAKN
nr:MAG TPA: tail assembly chaperone protein [Caudoviricetes sp.]